MRILFILSLLAIGCGNKTENLCNKYAVRYINLIQDRDENVRNAELIQGSKAYDAEDYEKAMERFAAYIARYPNEPAAYIYKAVSELQLGLPLDAERTLDGIEPLIDKAFADQTDYYNVVCLICSDQPDRALELARKFEGKRLHTYHQEFKDIVEALDR